MTREFNGLLKSEIKKAERLANKVTGYNDCKVTAYSSKVTHPFDFDYNTVYVEVDCEICRDYKEPIEEQIHLSIPMADRRMSFAWCMTTKGEYVDSTTRRK